MKRFTFIWLAIALNSFSLSALAQELDMSQIQQLACMADSISSSESSLDNIGSILTETLALYSETVSEEQLQAARNQANEAIAGIDLDVSIEQLCNQEA